MCQLYLNKWVWGLVSGLVRLRAHSVKRESAEIGNLKPPKLSSVFSHIGSDLKPPNP